MTDMIKRDDALAAIDMALNNATGDLFDCHAAIRALPAVASATLTPNPVDDSKTANPVVNDPAAIRDAALREAADVAKRGVDILGGRMRDAKDKKEKRDWQSMLFAAVDIKDAILALIGEKK